MNPFHKLKLSNYIVEDCGCADSGGGTGGAPVIQMAGKTTKHIITPKIKSQLVTEAISLMENELLNKLVLPDLAQKYIQKAPLADKLSKYNVKEAKELIGEEFKNNPELADKIVNKVSSIDESSVLGNIQNNLTQRYQNFKPSTTKAGHLISTHDQLSKTGQANSMMGSKQVIKNTVDAANGNNNKPSLKTESANILEEMQSFTYKQLTGRKPVITAVRPSNQKIETHYDKTIDSPTHHLKSGEKILVANRLGQVKGNLQADRDAIKKASSMQQSV